MWNIVKKIHLKIVNRPKKEIITLQSYFKQHNVFLFVFIFIKETEPYNKLEAEYHLQGNGRFLQNIEIILYPFF